MCVCVCRCACLCACAWVHLCMRRCACARTCVGEDGRGGGVVACQAAQTACDSLLLCFSPQTGTTTRFAFAGADESSVDNVAEVQVLALDKLGNVNTNEATVVEVTADGSVAGTGIVQISGGRGLLRLTNTVPETNELRFLTNFSRPSVSFSDTFSIEFFAGACPPAPPQTNPSESATCVHV